MSRSKELVELFEQYTEVMLERSPITATMLGDNRYNHLIDDNSLEAMEEGLFIDKEYLDKISNIDDSDFDETDYLNRELFINDIKKSLNGYDVKAYFLSVDHFSGPQMWIPTLFQVHPLNSEKDYSDLISRIGQFPTFFKNEIEILTQGMKEGIVPPKFSIELVIKQLDALLEMNDDSVFYLPLKKLSDDEHKALRCEALFDNNRISCDKFKNALEKFLVPALQEYRDFLSATYLDACSDKPGLSNIPGGKEIYSHLLGFHTTESLTPEEIHETGKKEVESILEKMKVIMEKVGFKGTLQEFFESLKTDKRFLPSNKEEYMNVFKDILAKMEAKIPEYFSRSPKLPYEVRAMEPFREKNAPTALYMPGPMDGSRPGIYYVNSFECETRSTYTLEALSYHEAVPGHHFQIALSRELDSLPLFRKLSHYTAYIEGWALYVERLALDMGFYGDPYSDFGRLTFDAWRSARLVIDTGIHVFNWTQKQACDYLRKCTSLCETDVLSEVDRYCVMAGQACSYKIGQLVILKLRKQAREKLGNKFDYKKFHDFLLDGGALPLDVLEEQFKKWLSQQ